MSGRSASVTPLRRRAGKTSVSKLPATPATPGNRCGPIAPPGRRRRGITSSRALWRSPSTAASNWHVGRLRSPAVAESGISSTQTAARSGSPKPAPTPEENRLRPNLSRRSGWRRGRARAGGAPHRQNSRREASHSARREAADACPPAYPTALRTAEAAASQTYVTYAHRWRHGSSRPSGRARRPLPTPIRALRRPGRRPSSGQGLWQFAEVPPTVTLRRNCHAWHIPSRSVDLFEGLLGAMCHWNVSEQPAHGHHLGVSRARAAGSRRRHRPTPWRSGHAREPPWRRTGSC